MVSINTNPGALIALQNLTRVNDQLDETQRRISTGLEVSSASDNPAIFALAQRQRAELGSIEAVQQGLRIAESAVDVGLASAESVSDILVELRSVAAQAADDSISTENRALLQDQFVALTDQISRLVSSADIGGRNLIDGSTASFSVLASADAGDTIDISGINLTNTSVLTFDQTAAALASSTSSATAIAAIETSIDNLSTAVAGLGAGGQALDLQGNLLTRIGDALETSIGNLVDADLARESTRLQALQVQQQLAIQTLSIANAAPNSILALFA